ncbi:N-acetylated-alpha-linked acidic dipeptidase [Sphingomonas vulcanisoli]|uniref:N-acetylated-alpha-linked acidic dipeptidase n=1 Tax=Sphingomonas vulcanisoli TaxID=1658060 RepID=A0ABX0TP70_9SPHN|nr:transferrin receptor-like dimerization domain-containing protein [Sphingomonas vulcanisoli]NIJ06554.1 N-acetylated-alpha-linked acidic dipeptidase [Sphingomonas vulcanisoli]
MIKQMLAGVCAVALTAAAIAQPVGQKAIESAFDAQINPTELTDWLKTLSSQPNHVGSPHDKANAEMVLGLFKQWGWDAKIETFQVLYPTPISTTVEMIAPVPIKLGGQEPAVPQDPSTADLSQALPPYVAYQGDGDVTAPLVYVNFGMPEDYKALARLGIDVKGKIAIARYGGGWRGLKPKLAQDHGAIGCIIYSDPADDGYGRGDVYPKGGWRNENGVQRGSVQDMVLYPGDPLTPGVGATDKAKRLTRAQAVTLLKIPALPMSYGDAGKLLSRLGGPVAPAGWRGGLPFAYHTGGDAGVTVHLAVKSDWSLKTLYDVIATVPGAKSPNQWVVRGNHRDGWVFGASDPLSGHVAMMGEAKAIGGLLAQGWRPDRTIVYASWDGEEPGLLGSTEWAETHAAELKAKTVAYLNSDNIGRGFFHIEGSHDLQHFANGIAADVTDPETGASLADRQRANVRTGGRADARTLAAAEKGGDLPIGALGSGSDYSAYLQHLGLPTIDFGFGGEDESGGVYHSAYDTFYHYTTFDDPGLKYSATLAKAVGRAVLRLSGDQTQPMRFGDFADTVAVYLDEVEKLADARRTLDRRIGKSVAAGDYRLAADPLKPMAAPDADAPGPHVELAALEDAVDRLKTSAMAFDDAYAAKSATLSPAARARLNAMLRDVDQLLIDDRGLPGRPWYKNLIYAPGRYTGYGAKTLPGVREAIEERRFDDANIYAVRTAKVLRDYADRLDAARAVVTSN